MTQFQVHKILIHKWLKALMPEKPAVLCEPNQNWPVQNPSKSAVRICRDFTILCDFDAILLRVCLFLDSAMNLDQWSWGEWKNLEFWDKSRNFDNNGCKRLADRNT